MQVFNDNLDHDNIDSVFITLFGDAVNRVNANPGNIYIILYGTC